MNLIKYSVISGHVSTLLYLLLHVLIVTHQGATEELTRLDFHISPINVFNLFCSPFSPQLPLPRPLPLLPLLSPPFSLSSLHLHLHPSPHSFSLLYI